MSSSVIQSWKLFGVDLNMSYLTIFLFFLQAANAIDSSWTMAMERADRAGVELAKSLIDR